MLLIDWRLYPLLAEGAAAAHYATGVALMDAGVVSCADMTVEAALTKLGHLLGIVHPKAYTLVCTHNVDSVVVIHCRCFDNFMIVCFDDIVMKEMVRTHTAFAFLKCGLSVYRKTLT